MEKQVKRPQYYGQLLGASVGIAAVIVLMLLAFMAPMMNSGPKDLPLAIVGPDPMVETISAQLTQSSPGAFDIE
ncbi:hypothetical protein ACFLIN_09730 [Corynebacterium kutscheri]